MALTAVVEANERTQEANQKRELVALALSNAQYWKEALDYRQCQDPETIRQYRVCESDPHHYAKPCSFTCHLRYCEDCAKREAARLKQRYVPAMEDVTKKLPSGYSLKHVVLTTKYSLVDSNGNPRSSQDTQDELRRMWQLVSKAFDEYFYLLTEVARHEVKEKRLVNILAYCLKVRLDELRSEGKAGWFNRLKKKLATGSKWYQLDMGYLAASEYGENGHKLHFHIAFFGCFIDKELLSEIWERLTGFYITHIRRYDTAEQAAQEILKYTVKLSQLPPQLVPLLHETLKGTRRVRSRGVFYNPPSVKREPMTCPICGDPLTYWLKGRYENWLAIATAVSIRQMKQSQENLKALLTLDLKTGNKSPPPSHLGQLNLFDFDEHSDRYDSSHKNSSKNTHYKQGL